MSDRTFQLDTPHMRGNDVEAWQNWLNSHLSFWEVDYSIPEDGDYGQATRDLTASVAHGMGIDALEAMKSGVTPALRVKMRNADLTDDEIGRAHVRRTTWLPAFRRRYARKDVSTPIAVILGDSWGWHPGVHDGVDLICAWKAPLLAIVTSKIVRVSSSGWWGNNPRPSPGHPVSDGDGIIILEANVNVGPFRAGMHFGYGHAEGATVKVGDQVKAGSLIGHAGFANAAHVHFMVNDDKPVNGLYRGVGDRDPKPFVDYARSHD